MTEIRNSDKVRLFLEVGNTSIPQMIEIEQLPATVGRSPDCQIIINDQTIAPVQFLIDRDEKGRIVVENYAGTRDNPTKRNRKTITQPIVVTKTPVTLSVGQLALTLRQSEDELKETIQLRPRGILGLFTLPIVAIGLVLALLWLGIFDRKLETIKPFVYDYQEYARWVVMFLLLLAYAVFVHSLRVRFQLFFLSASVLAIGLIGRKYLSLLMDWLEYALNVSSNELLGPLVFIPCFVGLWYAVLKSKLHLTWRNAIGHALLVSLPLLVASVMGIFDSPAFKTSSIRANINGTVTPYNVHLSKTQSIDAYFANAHKRFKTDETPTPDTPFVEPPKIASETQPALKKQAQAPVTPDKKINTPAEKSDKAKKIKKAENKTYTYVYSEGDLVNNDNAQQKVTSRVKNPRSRLRVLGKRVAPSPRLAIVIDDVATKAHIRNLNALNLNLNYSFLPPTKNHPNSASIAKYARNVMIHLPMQALNYGGEEIGTLHVGDSAEKIEQAVANAVSNYPNALFINNHTGSKFTSDDASMNALFKAMKKHDIAFLDSLTTQKSVARKYASRHQVPLLVRDVFLDDKDDYGKIARQLRLAVSLAKKNGQAIAIGHPRTNTLRVLNTHRHLLREVNLVAVTQLKLAE